MIHVSEISSEKRINHPQDVLRVAQMVKAQVLAVDREKRQIKLSIKQLAPTDIEGYLAEHRSGDLVSGRIVEISGTQARVELGEGIQAVCRVEATSEAASQTQAQSGMDLAALSSMLQARWKGGSAAPRQETPRAGQIRQFRITKLDPASKSIELQLA